MPRAAISRSRAEVWVSRYRAAAASLSLVWIRTVSPRTSTESTPGSACSAASLASGSVARTVRPAAIALISEAVPSATISPCRSRMIRSA